MLCENKVLEIYLKVKIFISQVYFASLCEIDKSYAKLIKIIQKLNIQFLLIRKTKYDGSDLFCMAMRKDEILKQSVMHL